jgi:long-chain fatty acid transport protein
MINPRKHALVLAVAATMALPGAAMATNGYFAHGYGVKSKGMAGAGVAMPLDAMDATTNPANMVNVGSRIDAGLTWFSPRRSYTASQPTQQLPPQAFQLIPGTFESENESFFIPNFGWNHMINDVSSVGITLAGNGGMNSEYDNVTFPGNPPGFPTGTYYAGKAGVDLMQLNTLVTYARKVNDMVSLGISGVFAFQQMKVTGGGSFAPFSSDPGNLSNKGYARSTGFGVKAGITADLSSNFAIAGSYQSKIDMSELDEYAGFLAEQGDFDIPATWTLGAKFSPSKQHTILLDFQRIEYSDVASIANPMVPNIMTARLGDDNGAGFGWTDMDVWKIGYQYDAGDWQARAGFSTNDGVIPESEVMFNILAPATVEEHWTLGFTKNLSKSSSLDFAFMYAPSVEIKGDHPFAGPTQQLSIEMEQYEAAVNYTWKY